MCEDTQSQQPPLSVIVIGASGDLATSKIVPALFSLFCQGFLPDGTKVFGFARTAMSHEEWRNRLAANLTCRYVPGESRCRELMDDFLSRCFYVPGQYQSREDFLELYACMRSREEAENVNRLYYLAIPPSLFLDVARAIGGAGLVNCGERQPGWSRAVIEKPFGRDRASSDQLVSNINEVFNEDQVFRIDHYLGKEVIQNLLVLRFANRLFEPVWCREHIQDVTISWQEDKGVGDRGGYFDAFGIIRDVMQNHLLQIVAHVAMERPARFDARHVRDAKVEVLRAARPVARGDMVVGQYKAGNSHRAYREEKGIQPDSRTPTFAAAVLHIENDRWKGVPFLLRAGKAMDRKQTEIRIRLKHLARNIFCASGGECLPRNAIVMRVQPDEAISCHITNKVPGLGLELAATELNLRYQAAFSAQIPDAYECLLLDVLKGDKSLFIRADELAAAWDVFTPVLHELEESGVEPEFYPFGAQNTDGARDLAGRYGFGSGAL